MTAWMTSSSATPTEKFATTKILVRWINPVSPRPKIVADLKARLHVEKADWNHDGRPDIIVSGSAHKIYTILNEGTEAEASFGEPVPLKFEIKGPVTVVADLNRDGDEDLLVNGTQGTSFVERSFVDHGYASAAVIEIEASPKKDQE